MVVEVWSGVPWTFSDTDVSMDGVFPKAEGNVPVKDELG